MMTFTTVGSMNFNVLRNVLLQGQLLQCNRGVEVGVLYGDTSAYLLSEFPTLTLYSVDPYLPYQDGDRMRTTAELAQFEQLARGKLAPFGQRSMLIKQCSVDAAQQFSDRFFDFVFIDANHDYQPVKDDINAWRSKVRVGGLLCGHDYRSFSGVTQAVDEFSMQAGLNGYHTPIESDLWFFVMP